VTDASDGVGRLFTDLGVLRTGHFRLSSGKHSDTYLQCMMALGRPAVALELGQRLAARLAHLEADVVASPALGGVVAGFVVAAAMDLRFVFTERDADRRMTLRRGQALSAGERVVVVEDVVTTGGSARETAAVCEAAGAQVVGFAALVDRSGGLPSGPRPAVAPVALLTIEPATWDERDCPRCRSGVPLDTPGSRFGR
jgi:orotate phosphoribosyltransferase